MNNIHLSLYTLVSLSVGASLYAVDPTFHIKNNSKKEIQFELVQQGKSITGIKVLLGNGDGHFNVDINKPTTIHIFHCLESGSCKDVPSDMIQKARATFPAGKTIYIKFDGKKIKAQEGKRGKTSKNYSTENNVIDEGKDKDFTQVNSQVSKSPDSLKRLGLIGVR